ncbi:MAG: flippase [Inconstantimicrobium porci]|uniref:flippase n=1 Tax=Inconstantimicrobium porci TaxID=2652291 RepID=UPI002A90E790|nr:flippase [Inconstantimicrobium porci]MDY5912360.1 flippase [Inconstantimicrobium porci]
MKKIFKNFLSLGLASVMSQLVSFLCVSYYAKILGVEVFGEITLAQQIVLYFTTFTLFGIQTYATRYLVKNKNKVNETVGKIVLFRLLVATLSFAIICFITLFMKRGSDFNKMLILFGCTIFPIAVNIDWLFNAFEAMKHNSIFLIFKNVLPAALIYVVIGRYKNYMVIPVATFIGGALGFLYQVAIAKFKFNVKFKFKITFDEVKKLCIIGSPFLFSSMLSMVNNNADKIILGLCGNDHGLGIYQSAYVFISFIISIIGLLFTAVFPSMSLYYYNKDKEKLNVLCNEVAKIIAVISVPMFVGGALLSREIILLFYKNEYYDAYKPFIILMLYVSILFVRELYAYGLNAWGKEKKYMRIVLVSSIANLILNIILTPRYGYLCAAMITLVTEFINLFAMKAEASKVTHISMYKGLLKAVVPSIIMGCVILIFKYFSINVVATILAAVAVYAVFIVLFKVITIQDIKKVLE